MLKESKQYISLYDSVMNDINSKKIEYTISDKYVSGLKPIFGIKEVIANFYDANGTDFTLDYAKPSLIIKDNNIGVNIKYMIIGNSGSREHNTKIGEHGEGYKIGALTIVRNGGRFLIHTVGYTIAFGMQYSDILKTNVMFAKYKENDKTEGTEVYLECKESDYLNARKMFLQLNDFQLLNKNIIVTPTKLKPLYLNGLEHVQKSAIFAYNFQEKNLVSNRDRNYISSDVIESNMRDIYENLTDSHIISFIMNAFMEQKNNFDKMLESKVMETLDLNTTQCSYYRNSLNVNDLFTTDKKLAENGMDDYNVVLVSRKLFNFLSLINANVIESEDDDEEREKRKRVTKEYSYTFVLNKSEVDSSKNLELRIGKIMNEATFSGGLLAENTYYFAINNFKLQQFSKSSFFSFLNNTFSLTENDKDSPFADLLQKLIHLSCNADFKVRIRLFGNIINFQSYLLNGKYHVTLKVDDNYYFAPKILHNLVVIIEHECELKNVYAQFEQNYIYLCNIKFKEINSIYSYKLETHTKNEKFAINDIIKNNIISNEKDFFIKLLDTAKLELLEHQIDGNYTQHYLCNLRKPTVKKLLSLFDSKYPKTCLACNDEYDRIVEEKYGYKLFKSSAIFLKQLNELGILNSMEVFSKEQNNEIFTIDFTPEMDEAVSIFRTTYNIDEEEIFPIYLALTLPENKESYNQNGLIYISLSASHIPEYIAGLIGYEYVQTEYNLLSPNHRLQSELTHAVLDN